MKRGNSVTVNLLYTYLVHGIVGIQWAVLVIHLIYTHLVSEVMRPKGHLCEVSMAEWKLRNSHNLSMCDQLLVCTNHIKLASLLVVLGCCIKINNS